MCNLQTIIILMGYNGLKECTKANIENFQTIIRGNSGSQVNGSNFGMQGGISVARSNSLRNSSPPARRRYQPDQNYPPLQEDGQMGGMPPRGHPSNQYPQFQGQGPPPYNRENRDPRDMYPDQYNSRDNRDPRNYNAYPEKNNHMRDNRYPNDRFDHPDNGRLQPPRDDYRGGSHPNSRDQSFEDRRSENSYRQHNDSYDGNSLRRGDTQQRHNQMPQGGRSPTHPQMPGNHDNRYPQQQQYPNGTLTRQQPPHQNLPGYDTTRRVRNHSFQYYFFMGKICYFLM